FFGSVTVNVLWALLAVAAAYLIWQSRRGPAGQAIADEAAAADSDAGPDGSEDAPATSSQGAASQGADQEPKQ
ncbi:MAG: hypothetical protein ACRDT8_15515, partial [Micromonosporaceae bacterium]